MRSRRADYSAIGEPEARPLASEAGVYEGFLRRIVAWDLMC